MESRKVTGLSHGKVGRGRDSENPGRKLHPAQMGQGTLKKGLLPEGGQGYGVRRRKVEVPRDWQQREVITTGKVGRGRGRH